MGNSGIGKFGKIFNASESCSPDPEVEPPSKKQKISNISNSN